jgi:KDO2-lipid IV(A) lauroyltransferase
LLLRLQYLLEAAAFFAMVGFFRLLGLERASAFGGWVGRTFGPLTPRHAGAKRRLKRVMPELSEAEADKILRGMWDNLGRTTAELPHLDKFHPLEPGGHCEMVGLEFAARIKAQGTGAIFVSGHFANWELMPMAMDRYGLKGGEIYRAANNPIVDNYVVGLRRKYVCAQQIPKGPRGVRGLVDLLRKKGHVAMLVDQKMNDGVEVAFFGIPSMSPSAAAQLHLRHGIPIVPASIERSPGPNFLMRIFEPIAHEATGDREADLKAIMTRVNAFLEERIRARPHEWLWLHKRWPEPETRSQKSEI